MEGFGILHKFHDSRASSQREDFVSSDAEVALASCGMVGQEATNFFEDLFHYCVLAEIIGCLELDHILALRKMKVEVNLTLTSCLKRCPSEH